MLRKKLFQYIMFTLAISIGYPSLSAERFNVTDLDGESLSPKMVHFLEQNGYLIIKDFFKQETIARALEEYEEIVKSFPAQKLGNHFFDTSKNSSQNSDTYFFESADTVWPFYNSTVTSESSLPSADLSNEHDLFEYLKTINKVGHNLHGRNAFFRDLVCSDPRFKNITVNLGYNEVSTGIYQTTIISKSLVDDSKYNAHQDGTFIGQQGKVLAYWIPFTPSTKENGCLWGVPGSHKFPIKWWYRKQDKESYKCGFSGESPDWDLSQKVYLETNPGDLLIFPGTFIHGSDPSTIEPKTIQDLRIAMTYHLGPTDQWDELMWLKLSLQNCLPL